VDFHFEVKKSNPPISFINPKKNITKLNSKEHELNSGVVRITEVICPGLWLDLDVVVKAKVNVELIK
jgi:hypothetical protein